MRPGRAPAAPPSSQPCALVACESIPARLGPLPGERARGGRVCAPIPGRLRVEVGAPCFPFVERRPSVPGEMMGLGGCPGRAIWSFVGMAGPAGACVLNESLPTHRVSEECIRIAQRQGSNWHYFPEFPQNLNYL